ncbi:PREDICTED: UDP-N-acetylglucosamine/UDP-glucose/GDP-mannose transporter isoform X2 [Chrysochloris asiatica]|uniref:UDP-N-acetylglucosamine/UDP-glucose/GDP-mannose transporter isoform X2 n=1 Tax=Chrysochloris asiatica TaxID=185453 RepID=A0A9B0WUR0_CHRAS|nr:PREDICTED: UDP-N-acetylglucosamine/UDP-glucose/GDP-mannose transporter isoform X2 [Chrysochloris asiatica]
MTAGGQSEGADADPTSAQLSFRTAKLLSALFYGTCSFLIVLVNKALLTTYGFPSPIVLGTGQMAVTIMILYVSKLNKIIHFPDFDKKIPVKLFPLPLLYVGNHISGLSSTSKLSLPMFTVLRKFTIPLTLLLETIILGKQYSFSIIVSVFAIILGAFIAAGFLLMYSTVLCSYYNSALTTAVVGAIKNVSIAYIGMLVGGDYIFSVLNFVGLNICMAGGLRYSFLTLRSQSKPKEPVDEESIPLDLKS